MTRREAAILGGQRAARERDDRIGDYLWIRGDRMPAWQAAHRLGVTKRTIERWRAVLRERKTTTCE